jgi:thioredoxin reductase (NADPH)
MRFFSSPDRIAIAGVPIHTPGQAKCLREEYLAYLRTVVEQFDLEINTFQRVIDIVPERGGFRLQSEMRWGERKVYHVKRIVLATGGTARPRELGIPGEDLPHVGHRLEDPHRYFRRRLLVVGGRNSAVEAALRCHHAGAEVTMSYRGDAFPESVKYWLRPEINMLIETGAIHCHFETIPTVISSNHVALRPVEDGDEIYVRADEVLLMVGYEADMTLFELAGVNLTGPQRRPEFDERTMETNVPGVYVAGTACAGTQERYRLFIENCHVHVGRIVAALTGQPPPEEPGARAEPEM